MSNLRFCFALALMLWPLTAAATETVVCASPEDPGVAVELNYGSGPPPGLPNWLRVATADEAWSTLDFDDVTPIAVRQAFDDGHLMQLDAVEPEFGGPLIAIRLLTAVEGDAMVRIGYLRVFGQSLHPIICDFGET